MSHDFIYVFFQAGPGSVGIKTVLLVCLFFKKYFKYIFWGWWGLQGGHHLSTSKILATALCTIRLP